MCATYGLGGGPYPTDDEGDVIEPMNERGSAELLNEWMGKRGGTAKITGKDARNFNPIIRAAEAGERSLELAWWWLHVGGAPAKFTAFNSRDDALVKRWKGAFQHRALIPADRYIEGKKLWQLPGKDLFAIAAITAPRTDDDGTEMLSYSMVTRHGIGEASTVISQRGESRMPLILPRDLHDEWLDPERPGDEDLVARVQHASEEISRAMTTGTGDDGDTLF